MNGFFFTRCDEPFFHFLKYKIGILAFSLSISCSFAVNAASLDIFQLSAFVNATELGPSSLQQDQLGLLSFTEIQDTGLNVSFDNRLNPDNLGTFSWQIKNTLASDLSDVNFFAFLDMEIIEFSNTYFNESGALLDVSGSGSGDIQPDSWEIDEPGFLFGDIYDNLLNGVLDNSNAVPAGLEEDVSLALGFSIGRLLAGETIRADFTISATDIGGLSHTDPDAELTFYFNGTADVLPASASVPEPNILTLMVLSPLLLPAKRVNRSKTG